jgi:apolipoprotein D and lipocalin family protein
MKPQRPGLSARVRALAIACVAAIGAAAIAGCSTAPPAGLEPVTGFQLERYLGNWYEIARLDHSFERGLSDVTATYRKRTDGGLDVINRGYDTARGSWREAQGRAYLLAGADQGSLKVSFFGPFYGGYHVIDLDRADYSWALVVGPGRDYFWLLARTPKLDRELVQQLVARAARAGIDTERLIWVEHTR